MGVFPALFALAHAPEVRGDAPAARASWQAIVDDGYARLYQSPLYLAARRALAQA